jgi:hypothetical protein
MKIDILSIAYINLPSAYESSEKTFYFRSDSDFQSSALLDAGCTSFVAVRIRNSSLYNCYAVNAIVVYVIHGDLTGEFSRVRLAGADVKDHS